MSVETKIVSREQASEPMALSGLEKCRRYFRKFGALPLVALFIASWIVPRQENSITRLAVAYVPIAVLMFGAALAAEPHQQLTRSGRWRVRQARAGKMALWRRFGSAALHGLLIVVAFQILLYAQNPIGVAMISLRLAAGTAFLYAVATFLFETSGLCCALLGYSLPALHRTPLLARSLGEFWARRWNIIVSAWLHTFVFRTLARRGYVRAGILCSFFASGFFHAWPMLAALGTWAAFSTMAFFLIQGAGVLIENRLRIRTWPEALARMWTIMIVLGTSPLFIDPGLRAFGL